MGSIAFCTSFTSLGDAIPQRCSVSTRPVRVNSISSVGCIQRVRTDQFGWWAYVLNSMASLHPSGSTKPAVHHIHATQSNNAKCTTHRLPPCSWFARNNWILNFLGIRLSRNAERNASSAIPTLYERERVQSVVMQRQIQRAHVTKSRVMECLSICLCLMFSQKCRKYRCVGMGDPAAVRRREKNHVRHTQFERIYFYIYPFSYDLSSTGLAKFSYSTKDCYLLRATSISATV